VDRRRNVPPGSVFAFGETHCQAAALRQVCHGHIRKVITERDHAGTESYHQGGFPDDLGLSCRTSRANFTCPDEILHRLI